MVKVIKGKAGRFTEASSVNFVPCGGQIIKTTAGVQAIREGGIKNKKANSQFPPRE